jgi:hypothetical protein
MTGQMVGSVAGQWVDWTGHCVGWIGQMVASLAPLGHWVGFVATGQVVGAGAHSVTLPEHWVVTTGQVVTAVAGHSVVFSGQVVIAVGHCVGTLAGHWVATVGHEVWAAGQWVATLGHSVCFTGQ